MTPTRALPVLMPNVPEQRWKCHSCGDCCRTLVGHLFPEERARLDEQGWASKLDTAPYVRVGRGFVLNKREDGACVFLSADNRCRIHAELGEAAKPLACRVFPFSLRRVNAGWQASLRFDCPSVIASKGVPISQHRAWLRTIGEQLDEHSIEDAPPLLQRGRPASPEEIDAVTKRLVRWLKHGDKTFPQRLIGAARLTSTLSNARLAKVHGPRFAELLDLLIGALPAECAVEPDAATPRQRGMLRQLAFAHGEHLTLSEMRSRCARLLKRWRQFRNAGRFRQGWGKVPRLPGAPRDTTFDRVEAVEPDGDAREPVERLLLRYCEARIAGSTVFGSGYYGWPMFTGLAALWLSIAVTGWMARYLAALDDRPRFTFDDVGAAIGIVDRAATRLPALGTFAERTRIAYLLRDDGVARLLQRYALVAETT